MLKTVESNTDANPSGPREPEQRRWPEPLVIQQVVDRTRTLVSRSLGVFLGLMGLHIAATAVLRSMMPAESGSLFAFAQQAPFGVLAAVILGLELSLVTSVDETTAPEARSGVGAYLKRAFPRSLVAIVTLFVYWLITSLGLILLILPGLWIFVRWHYAYGLVIDGKAGVFDAFSESHRLGKGRPWTSTALVFLTFVPSLLAGGIQSMIFGGADTSTLFFQAVWTPVYILQLYFYYAHYRTAYESAVSY